MQGGWLRQAPSSSGGGLDAVEGHHSASMRERPTLHDPGLSPMAPAAQIYGAPCASGGAAPVGSSGRGSPRVV
eukprot:3456661-Alexandrium_andersonii.AAC.1